MGGGCGWSSIEPTRVVARPSAGGGGASTGGEGLQWWVFPLGITQQWRSVLWWFRLPPQAFLAAEHLTPIPSGCPSPPAAVLSAGLLSTPHVAAPSCRVHQTTPSSV